MPDRKPIFEHYVSVKTQRLKRFAIFATMGIALVFIGYSLAPQGTFFKFVGTEVSFFRHTVGHFIAGGGFLILFVETVRFLLARKSSGAWHIRLTNERLSWQAPRQPYGREASFDYKLSNIEKCECRYLSENSRSRSYWLCPVNHTPIRLKDTSGVNIPRLLKHLEEHGVPYREVET